MPDLIQPIQEVIPDGCGVHVQMEIHFIWRLDFKLLKGKDYQMGILCFIGGFILGVVGLAGFLIYKQMKAEKS